MKNQNTETVKTVIAKNYNRINNTVDVASIMNCNYETLREKFPKDTGITIRQYLFDVRCRYVKHYLKTTDWKLYRIAKTTGFKDEKHLGRVFQKIVGMSPDNYRNNLK